MAFSTEEQQIIEWAKANGKTGQETRDAIFRFRSTGSPADPSKVAEPVVERAGTSFAEDVSSSFKRRTEDVAEGIVAGESPLSTGLQFAGATLGTVADVGFAGAKAAGKFILPKKAEEAVARGFESGVEKVLSTDTAQRAIELAQELDESHPELSRNLRAGLGIVEGVGTIGAGALVKPIIRGVSATARKTASALDGIPTISTQGIQDAVSRGLNPSDIMQRVARISKGKQANFEGLAKESIGEYLVNRGIFGNIDSISTQLFSRFNTSRISVDKAFASLEGTHKVASVGNMLKQLLAKQEAISTTGAVSRNLEKVKALSKKNTGEGLTMTEINEVKRLFERDVRLDFVKENLPDKVAAANTLDDAVRQWQRTKASELGVKNLVEMNRETQLAKQLLDDLGKEYAGAAGNNAVTLTDWIVISGGTPANLGGFLAKKALSSKGIMAKVAERLSPKEPKVGLPKAEFGEPTVDGYINWLRSVEERFPKDKGGIPTKLSSLEKEAVKFKTADEFVEAKQKDIVYHGSSEPLERFDDTGAFFTDDFNNADGYGSGENIYEGFLDLKNPLVIDAKGRHHSDLVTKYGESTQEVVSNVENLNKYDGVIFRNINDSFADDVEGFGTDNIFYPFNANKSFINESQLTEIWNKANK